MIGGMITAKEDATWILPRKTVKPGHGIFKALIALTTQFEKMFQRLERDGFSIHPRSSYAFELNVGPRDHSCKAEPANGGVQHVSIHIGIGVYGTGVRAIQVDLLDMRGKRSGKVMVFTMYVN